MDKIKVVLIDIDNTLLSFSEYVKNSMKEGFSHFGLKPYSEDMFHIFEEVNNGLWRQIEQGTLSFEELKQIRWNRIFQELHIDFDGITFEKYFREQLFDSAIPEPGAMDLLNYLSSKYTLCAVSNGPYHQQMHRLEIGGMIGYFAHCFISSQVGAQKPSRAFFDYCFKVLRSDGYPHLKPDEVFIIGDSMTSDISGGLEYGIHTCLYRKNVPSVQYGRTAEYEFDSLSDVRNIL